MLPLPNLDDRSFEQLVSEARSLIPGIIPEWTDENAHDPGITLLELLAWHLEMQQFQTDRITASHDRKFLRLLGETTRDVVPSTTSVSISKSPYPMYIPYGTLLRVRDLPFETIRAITVLPDSNQEITTYTKDGANKIEEDMTSGRVTFYPFGQQAEAGASMVIALGKALPQLLPLSLWIELDDQDPAHRIPARYKHFTPSGQIEWSYWHTADNEEQEADGWRPLQMERDETYGLQQSGPILFAIPKGARQVRRIRALLAGGGYNDPPRIRRMVWNEVFATQGQTLCMAVCFNGKEAGSQADPDIMLEHGLFLQSELAVQFRTKAGWVDVSPSSYWINYTDELASLQFQTNVELPSGKESIRVIANAREFSRHIYLGTGTGISHQQYVLPVQPLLAGTLGIQVGWLADDKQTMLWQDWERVYDFDESDDASLHYIIDTEEGVIRFSDGVHGVVPPACTQPNIRIINYRIGTGAAGNVKADTIHELDYFNIPLHVTNLFPAYGGMEEESLQAALQRAKLAVLEPKCGITAQDIEKRVGEIPGLRLVRIKAINGYNPRRGAAAGNSELGHIAVVVVPYSRSPLPYPTEGMLHTIRTHLEPYRLLTTTLHVIPPDYIKVTVRSIVVVHPRYEGREHEVRHALQQWLQPYGSEGQAGWEFGKTIYKSDVFNMIHRVPGIQYIQDVWLSAEGNHAFVDEGGDIRIPPNGLAISGDHDIEFIVASG